MTQVSTSDNHEPTHNLWLGYVLWIFGFMGAHRFYYGKPLTGTLWFFTLGLFFVGWIIDLLLIPSMAREATTRFRNGRINYSLSWLLLTFTGVFGLHRFYMRKIVTGIIYLLTGGLFLLGILYDFWTLNQQLSECNARDDGKRLGKDL
ncbi:NINE protein [Larsenimonas suaedae]|uniref:TM2 domain-containing protein n=1 Tax=Larsenimonas suaedae TaxID=1851019 RepID=A0ABU1GYS8_9GAMM|nr:TM2 domain-containing protein [Larsenimonas suaedae]MCM2971465.1 TM2 domain-containing protein [Larsenimonas suaedae]MDR5896721.1 TM2 domain-containing protein [Larsenimonas suaedae]